MPHRALALPLVLLIAGIGATGPTAADLSGRPGSPKPRAVTAGTWSWPVHGPILRGFDPPQTQYGAGHRGIDVAVAFGTVVRAPEAGSVGFAGKVGGHLFVTLDHGGGLESTYSWLSALLVHKGDTVARGQPIATSGSGHPGSLVPHLHLGVKAGDVYVDPLLYLGPIDVRDLIRLAPMDGSWVAHAAA